MSTEKIVPTILAGGAGSRLWPESRRLLPKQLRPLGGGEGLLSHALQRICDGDRFAPPLVVCGTDIQFQIDEQIRESEVKGGEILAEPCGRGTAAAICAAALRVAASQPSALLLVLPSDAVIRHPTAFDDALERASVAARRGWIAVFAETAAPRKAEDLHVEGGEALSGLRGCTRLGRFVSGGSDTTRPALCRGAVVAEIAALLELFAAANPALLAACQRSLAGREAREGILTLDAAAHARAPAVDFETLLGAHPDKVAVVGADMGWADVDTWSHVWDVATKDNHGNATAGEVVARETRDCLLHSDGRLLATLGLADTAVVVSDDAVLVCPRDRTGEVGKFAEHLGESGHEVTEVHTRVHRPWGSYKGVHSGAGFQVKELTVRPGSVLSLQRHRYRAEHWVVVSGEAEVTCDDRVFRLKPNQSTFVPLGAVHRLANPGEDMLRVIEVQYGSYLGEDDIERIEDVYGRVPQA
jgi:mannose-1-phosphate guanylyltransferase/mannose-6-phosphate isomerase